MEDEILTCLRPFELVELEVVKQNPDGIEQRYFFNYLNAVIRELIVRYGKEQVIRKDEETGETIKVENMETLEDILPIRWQWLDALVYGILFRIFPENALYAQEEAAAGDAADESVDEEEQKYEYIRRRGWY